MRAIKKIILIVIISLLLLMINIYATNKKVYITSEENIEPGQTSKMQLILESSEDYIGVINGKLQYTDNISSIEIKGKNGWQITYNQITGDLYALKAEGAQSEEIAEITYSTKNNAEGKCKLTFSNINLTTIKYQIINCSNIFTEVTVIDKINVKDIGSNFSQIIVLKYLIIIVIFIVCCFVINYIIKHNKSK